jgi:hypothetical protein
MLGLGLLGCLPAATAAGHGVLRREGDVLRYRAQDPGVGAKLTVTSPLPRLVLFTDTTSPNGMDWGPCLPLSERRSRCRLRGVDHARIEVYDGPDVIRVRVPLPAQVDGGDGQDRIAGGYGADSIQGGPGSDVISGGPGRDAIAGGPGDDLIRSRDGAPDQITCADGNDTVIADPADLIAAVDLPACEEVRRSPAPPDSRRPLVRLRVKSRQSLGAGAIALTVSISEPGSLAARGALRLPGRAPARLRPAGCRPDAPGQAWTLRLALPRGLAASARRALRRGRRVRAGVSVSGRDRSGNRSGVRHEQVVITL